MQALVHFTVGVFMAILVLVFVDRPVRQEFLAMFLSGFWGLIPDGYWILREFGVKGPVNCWKSFHQTTYANLFWFHRFIDSIETGRNNLEAGISLAVLFVFVLVYYRYNDWTIA